MQILCYNFSRLKIICQTQGDFTAKSKAGLQGEMSQTRQAKRAKKAKAKQRQDNTCQKQGKAEPKASQVLAKADFQRQDAYSSARAEFFLHFVASKSKLVASR